MAALPAWAWLGVGLLLASVSWYVEGLEFFFWTGWLFILIGTARFVIAFVTRKESVREKKHFKQPGMLRAQHEYYRCNCGNTVKKTDNFCSWCGRRLH